MKNPDSKKGINKIHHVISTKGNLLDSERGGVGFGSYPARHISSIKQGDEWIITTVYHRQFKKKS
jgi:hypothetical protein